MVNIMISYMQPNLCQGVLRPRLHANGGERLDDIATAQSGAKSVGLGQILDLDNSLFQEEAQIPEEPFQAGGGGCAAAPLISAYR